MIRRTFIAWAAACASLPAAALLMRPDRDEAEYLELATRYASGIPLPAPGGEAVLIAPRWLLTAAHRARALQDSRPMPAISLGGRGHEVRSIHGHPEWKPGAREHDIALIFLREPAAVEPTPIYRAADESGKGVVIVGHGNGKRRAAINTVDRVAPHALALRIKPLDAASDLQGAATAAETGGPAIIQARAGLFVAGILAAADPEWQLYARVSAYADWIDATMFKVAQEEAARK